MPNIRPGVSTLGVIRKLAADKCDQPDPSFQTNATLSFYDGIVNRSGRELIRLLVNSYQNYFVNPDTGNPFRFETDGENYLYALPDDFAHLLRVDVYRNPWNLNTAQTARRYMNQETNQYTWFQPGGIICPQYDLIGSQIGFIPRPPMQGLGVQINYVPVLPDMCDRGTITLTEQPTAGDSITIAALTTLPQTADDDGAFPITALTPRHTYIAGSSIIPVPGATFFAVGDSMQETAQNLANAIREVNLTDEADGFPSPPWTTGSTAQDQGVVTVTQQGATVTLQLLAPLCIVWETASAGDSELPADGIQLSPLPVASQYNPYAAWSNFCTTYNGWDELIAVDAALQIMQKQEKFGMVDVLSARKAEMWAEIRSEANNRNAAQAARTTNLRRLNGFSRFGRFGGGPGGW